MAAESHVGVWCREAAQPVQQGTHQSRMYAGIFHAGRSASAGAAAAEATIVLVRRCCCCRVQKGGSAVAETRPCGSEMVHGTETGRRRL